MLIKFIEKEINPSSSEFNFLQIEGLKETRELSRRIIFFICHCAVTILVTDKSVPNSTPEH